MSKVNALKNDHLIQIVTSFTYRDEFNIVFRRMTTNLERALRDPQHLLEQIVSPLRMCPLWPQMLGLAQALHDFSTGSWKHNSGSEESEAVTGEAERAIHFDLKPSNILVDRSSRTSPTFQFVITDFGLAHIKTTQGGSSGTHDGGGDEEYAPPECRLPTQNRKYDVWSLGCIFLEIVTFLVAGHEGVTELDNAHRQTSSGRTRQTHCFWEPTDCPGPAGEKGLDGFRLKESVRLFIDTIRDRAGSEGRYSTRERDLVNNTLQMIEKMLCTQPKHRLTSADVVWWLKRVGRGEEVLAGHAASSQRVPDRPMMENPWPLREEITPPQDDEQLWWNPVARAVEGIRFGERRDDEIELEPRRLRRLHRLLVRSNVDSSEEDSNAILQVFESGPGHLRFVVIFTNLSEERPLEQTCPREEVHLMPQYAFRKDHTTPRSDAGIRLVWRTDSHKPIMRYDISGHLDDLRIVHSALLGQDVYYTVEVRGVQIKPPHSTFRKTPKWSDKLIEDHGPFTVQLWRQRNGKPRSCRLVIYFSTRACIIPFHQYLRLLDNDTMMRQPETTSLRSSTVGGTKQTFEMTILQTAKPSEILPTFPLDTEQLEDMLTQHPVTFKNFTIDFRASEHLMDFWKAYKVLKEDWLCESGIMPRGVP